MTERSPEGFARAERTAGRHRAPPLMPVAIVHVLLFFAALLSVAAFAGGERYPSPFDGADAILRFFATRGAQVRAGGFFLFGAAIPLAIFSATASSRLRFLGVRAAGETIALVGGVGASFALAASGLCSWALSVVGGLPDGAAAVRALHLVAFALGGPAAVVLSGLLVAGVAVTSGFARLLPRWLVWSGVAVAFVAELSWLVLLVPATTVLLPLARFPGLAWLVAAGAMLPRSRLGGEA